MTPIRRDGPRAGRWIALGLACASAAISGCTSRAGAERVPPPPVVGVVEARRMTVPMMVEPIGTTEALQQVSLRARVRGFLKEINFKEGDEVKAGQLLFVIEEEPFKAKLDAAKATLAEAEAALAKAKTSKAREVADAQLAADQATLELNRIEERRKRALAVRNAASQEDVDQATATRKKTEAQVEADRANADQAKTDFDVNIQAAEANVAKAKSDVESAAIDLSYCRMYSPIDGRIGKAEVKLGNLVGTPEGGSVSAALGGQQYTELAVVRQLDPMGVDMQAPSRYLDRVTELIGRGLAVEVFRPGLEGEGDRRSPGKATFIDNSINPTTSTFLVRAEVANPSKTLLPGEYVKVNAKVGEVKDAIVVPEQAVVEMQAGPTVYTVDKQGKVAVVPVRATFTHEGLRVVESGLEPGQAVIVEGLQLVRNGVAVKTRPASPESLGEAGGEPATTPAEKKAAEGSKTKP
jgi:RND family efflux transporter MFP subunit